MASTQEILDKARELGDMIGEHDAARKMEEAIAALQDDVEAQRALNDYQRHLQSLAQKQAQGQEIGENDQQQLERLQNTVIRNAKLRDLQVAQMDYADLMRQVDEAMTGQTAAPPPGAGGMSQHPEVASILRPQG